jgi:hypothetical protein
MAFITIEPRRGYAGLQGSGGGTKSMPTNGNGRMSAEAAIDKYGAAAGEVREAIDSGQTAMTANGKPPAASETVPELPGGAPLTADLPTAPAAPGMNVWLLRGGAAVAGLLAGVLLARVMS